MYVGIGCTYADNVRQLMLRGGSTGSAGGPRQPAETGIDRAENLGPGGGQRTWKPGPDAAVGPTGAQESTPILFPSASTSSGKSGGSRAGGPRGMDEEGGRPGAGTRHATQPPAGAAAGGRASTVATHAITVPPNHNVGYTIHIHTPLRPTLEIITRNSDNELLG